MTKILQKILIAALALSTLSSGAKADSKSHQKTKSFYVESREPYLSDDEKELCRQVAKILDEPENKKFSEAGFYEQTEFLIPYKYSNFSLPEWEDVKREDLTQYVGSQEWLASVKKYEDSHPDPKEKLIIQKTKIDLDEDGKDEVVLRFGVLYSSVLYWSSFVSDVNPTLISQGYNKGNGLGHYARPFKYKNKVYQFNSSSFDSIAVYESSFSRKTVFVISPVCFISLTPSAKKKAMKKWGKLEEMN